ncbi:MAG: PEP-CTERM system TPR-repeat protein PrsT [Thiotrichales bacterium]|nr:PEP-CTERM system TPR-repeat protein PrsT [Thiotrichales bacterium]
MYNVIDDTRQYSIKKILNTFLLLLALGCITACSEDLTPEQHMEKARAFLAEKKIFEGIIELKNALQKEGNLPEARWLLGEAYLKLGDGGLANREFTSARSLGYSHAEMDMMILRALNLQGKFQEVLDKTAALAESENSAALQLLRADAYLGLRQHEEAGPAYRATLEMDATLAPAYVGLSRLALSARDLGQAEQYIAQGLEADAENTDLWVLKGMLLLIQNKGAEADQAFLRAKEIAPYNRMASIGIIRARYAQGKFEEALPILKTLQNRYGKAPTVKYLRAYYEYQAKNVAKAKELLLDVIKVAANHPESLLLLSNILYQDGKLEQVIGYMERFTGRFPNHLPAVKLLAVAYLGQGEIDKTIDLIQQALKTRTADDQLYSILGTAYIRSGDLEQATEYLEKATEINPDAANIRAQLALSHLAAGSTDLAVSALEDAVELNPKLYSADIMLILTHIRAQNFEAAIKAAENLHNKEPDNPLPLNLLGTAHAGQQDYARAREYFELAVEKKPDYTPAKFNLANLDMEEGSLDAAQQRFEDILKDDEKSAKAYVGLAKLESERGNEANMLDYLKQARAVNENSIEVRVLLARYYKNTSRNREMLEVIEEAVRLAPNFTEVIFLGAQAQRLNGQYDNARRNLELLVKEFPEATDVLMEQALLQMDLGEIEAAGQTLQRILSLKDDHERAMLALINLELRQNRPEAAREALEKFAAAYPDSADLSLSRGDLALYEKNYPQAIEHYRQALTLRETSFVVFRIVNTYLVMNDTDNAHAVMEQWIADHPDDRQVKLVLASRYQQGANIERAIRLYEEVIRDDPSNMIALNNLAWMYLDSDAGQALQLAERAFQLAPEQPEVMDTFGWILVLQGSQVERGVQLIQAALDKKPDEASIRFHYAYALAKTGNRKRAKDELQKILNENASFPELKDAEALMAELQ